jgi:hypothetical protein
LTNLNLWQFSLFISGFLLALGFTGGIPFTDITLSEGRELGAILGGLVFYIGGVILRYMPPPETKGNDDV